MKQVSLCGNRRYSDVWQPKRSIPTEVVVSKLSAVHGFARDFLDLAIKENHVFLVDDD